MSLRLALLLLVFTQAHAQPLDFSIRWGYEFETATRSTLYDVVGHDATSVYAVRIRYGTTDFASYAIERYDDRFFSINSRELQIIEGGETARVLYVLHLKGQLYVFYVLRNRPARQNELFVSRIDKETLLPEQARRRLAIANEGMFPKELTFKVTVSRDSSKVAISYEYPKGLSETKGFGFFVLNDNLQVLWRPQVDLPNEKGHFVVENFKVDNVGNVYVLGVRYSETPRSKRDLTPSYTYEILAWSHLGKTIRTYPIMLDGLLVTDMQIEVIDTKNLVCAGFYSTPGTFSIRGTYFLTVSVETGNIRTSSLRNFDNEFVVDNLSDRDASNERRRARDEGPALYDYDLNNLLLGRDGSAILIGEQYFIEQTQSTSFLSQRMRVFTSRTYHYNDIIAVKIDPAGQIVWARKIAKSQRTTDDNGFSSSYALAIVKGKICFLFNDRPENIKYAGIGRPLPYSPRHSVVILASINQRGEQTRQSIFTRSNMVIHRPRSSRQISNNEVVLFSQRNTRQQLVGLLFD